MIHGVLVLVNCMKNNNLAINIFFAIAIALSTILVGKLKPQEKQAIAEPVSQSEAGETHLINKDYLISIMTQKFALTSTY